MSDIIELTDQERCEHVARVIEQLLREHQLAGFFMVCAPTHGTHALTFDSAPWLRLSIETHDDGAFSGIRIRSKLDEYMARGLSERDARACQEREMNYTINAIDHIATQAGPISILLLELLQKLRARIHIETTIEHVGDAEGKLR